MILLSGIFILSAFAQDPNKIINQLTKINTPLNCSLSNELSYGCDSMTTLSCKPGTFDDGTGKALSNEDYQSKIDPMKNKVKGFYRYAIEQMLKDKDPKFSLIRELAIKAAKQDGTPDCTSAVKNKVNQCYERVANSLASKQISGAFSSNNIIISSSSNSPTSASEIDFGTYFELTGNQVYQNALNKAEQKSLEVVTDKKLSQNIEKIFSRVLKK